MSAVSASSSTPAILWEGKTLAQALALAAIPAIGPVTSVTIDSRRAERGSLFVALPGERFDGHDFVATCLEKGAVAAIVSHIPAGMSPSDPRLIPVPDTSQALRQLGAFARQRFSGRVVGITGSVGKTGTKELVRCVLSALGSVYATEGNKNNHYGVPLMLANLPETMEYAVLEMGMNHAGEISDLTRQVLPHVAVITTVEAVHLEFFDGVEGIARAKAEIFEGVTGSGAVTGTVILNRDNPYFPLLAKLAQAQSIPKIISFGAAEEADCRLLDYAPETIDGITTAYVQASINHTPIEFHLNAIGRHWALNAMAALGVVEALGGDLAKATAALAYFHEPEGRGKPEVLKLPQGSFTLIDDSYNASPASVRSSIAKLAELRDRGGKGSESRKPRTLLVLGDMLELGERSAELHRELATSVQEHRIDKVLVAGMLMSHLYQALPEALQAGKTEKAMDLLSPLLATIRAGDMVLIKGSHGSKMYELAAALRRYVTEGQGGTLTQVTHHAV
jgi:UDP-N-acetylmuramoyl-tripeptide--D-alanyl-D-alanine ligase